MPSTLSAVQISERGVCCFKQKTAYEVRISDWSSDVCASALLTSRLIGEKLSRQLNTPVVVEDMPGGGGIIGMQGMLNAAPDGHTLEIGSASCRERVCQYV